MADVITISEPSAAADARGAPESYELEQLRCEYARLDQARRELLDTLDLRTRRLNQLLGQRDQLERQLVRAEAALQELNRQLGATAPSETAPAAPAPPPQPTLRGLLFAGLARFRPRRAENRAAPRAQDQGPVPHDRTGPLIPFARDGAARQVICLVAFGLEADQRTSVLDIALRFGAEHGVVPLVLTDDDDFAPLRSRGIVFEYFPPRSVCEARAPALEWDLYLQRRLAVIRRKWRPTRVIAFGEAATIVVQLWSESPFEDPSLGALPAARRHASAPGASIEVSGTADR